MAVARTNIINFFSEEDFDKYFALHKEFASSLDECGLLVVEVDSDGLVAD